MLVEPVGGVEVGDVFEGRDDLFHQDALLDEALAALAEDSRGYELAWQIDKVSLEVAYPGYQTQGLSVDLEDSLDIGTIFL